VKITPESLRERYASLADDELLSIYVSADLSGQARALLDAELTARGLGADELTEAGRTEAGLAAVRNQARSRDERRVARRLGVLVVVCVVAAVVHLLWG
jgi:hypothetical protein